MRLTVGDKTIIYTADTSYQKEWIDFSKNAQLLIADTNLYDEQKNLNIEHMTSTEAASIVRDANIETIIMRHLPQYGNNDDLITEAQKIYEGEVNLAKEGLIWRG